MKVLGFGVLLLGTVICEFPPPYSGSFRPSQPLLLPARGPIQTAYGPPKQLSNLALQTQYGLSNIRNVEFLEDLLGPILPPRIVGRPQTSYVDNFGSQHNSFRIVSSRPQTTYGAPSKQQLPGVQYGAPFNNHQPSRPFGNNVNQNWQQLPNKERQPQVIYGVPHRPQFGVTEVPTSDKNSQTPRPSRNNLWQNYRPDISQNNYYRTPTGQVSLGANSERHIQGQYGLPDQKGIESFDRFQQKMNQYQQQSSTDQYLPLREAVNFRYSPEPKQSGSSGNNLPGTELSEQYLPMKGATIFRTNVDQGQQENPRNFGGVQNDIDLPIQNQNFRHNYLPQDTDFPPQSSNSIDIRQVEVKSVGQSNVNAQNYQTVSDRYLPPSTTPTVATERLIPTAITAKPTPTTVRPIETTVEPTDPTILEDPLSETEEKTSENPNVAIATAVASPVDQTFYLVQPDGRLQRVIYQRTKEEGDEENEYTANYNFQNIQADPNLVYTPLITLG